MFLLVSMVVVVAAAPADVTSAIPGFSCAAEIPGERCEFYAEFLSDQLSNRGNVKVTTAKQMTTLLGMERQKALLGCGESSSSCLAELAGGLGAEVVITGSIARVGEEFAGTFKALKTKDASILVSRSVRVRKEEALLDFLSTLGAELHTELLQKLRGVTAAAAPAPSRFGPGVLIPGALGVASLVASGVLFGVAKGAEARLRDGDPMLTTPQAVIDLAQQGNALQVASVVTLAAGVVALGVATVLFFLAPDSKATAWLQPRVSNGLWAWRLP